MAHTWENLTRGYIRDRSQKERERMVRVGFGYWMVIEFAVV